MDDGFFPDVIDLLAGEFGSFDLHRLFYSLDDMAGIFNPRDVKRVLPFDIAVLHDCRHDLRSHPGFTDVVFQQGYQGMGDCAIFGGTFDVPS